MAENQKWAKEKNHNSFGNLSTLLCYSSKPSSNIVKSAEKILRAHIPKHAAMPHIDCIRNPLKLWTDKTMHGLVWIRTIEPAQWHFISVHLMESAIKVNESNAKKWHYFYRCNFFFSLLLLSLLAMEACRQNDMSSKLLFLFSIRLIYFMNLSSMFFSILFAIVFGISLQHWAGMDGKMEWLLIFKHNIDINACMAIYLFLVLPIWNTLLLVINPELDSNPPPVLPCVYVCCVSKSQNKLVISPLSMPAHRIRIVSVWWLKSSQSFS